MTPAQWLTIRVASSVVWLTFRGVNLWIEDRTLFDGEALFEARRRLSAAFLVQHTLSAALDLAAPKEVGPVVAFSAGAMIVFIAYQLMNYRSMSRRSRRWYRAGRLLLLLSDALHATSTNVAVAKVFLATGGL